MRIGIFDPYLDTLGGGERYVLTAALCLSRKHTVYIFWDSPSILSQVEDRFALDLSSVHVTENIFTPKVSFLHRLAATSRYDVIFYVSDGSIPALFAKKNILLFQFPVNWANGKDFLTRIKLLNVHKIICYSYFVKVFLDKTFSVKSIILSPPIETFNGQAIEKENLILTVGRFTKGMNTKKQEILIKVFKNIWKGGLSGWKLILVGSVLPQDEDFVKRLRNEIEDYPIEIITNISLKMLVSYYKKAKIYWHATGFGEDLIRHPERAEHFGISTVEAMSAGAVPIVFNAGGQREIVKEEENGLLWNTLEELQDKTLWVIRDKATWQRLSVSARLTSRTYSKERFCKELDEIVKK